MTANQVKAPTVSGSGEEKTESQPVTLTKELLKEARKEFNAHTSVVEIMNGVSKADAQAIAYFEGAEGLSKRLAK
jgi:hypothetical protein